jgi:hypothetical protein
MGRITIHKMTPAMANTGAKRQTFRAIGKRFENGPPTAFAL